MRRPSYQEEDRTYQADTCQGLVEGVAAGRVRLGALVHGHYPGRPLPGGALPGVKTVGFWDAVADQDWGLDWHRNEEPVWPATPKLGACFREIAKAVQSDDGGRNVSRLTVCLNDLFLLVLELFRLQSVPLDRSLTSTQRTVQLFWQELQQNRDHLAVEWTVARMAKRCGLGVTRFTQLSKELTNMRPMQYLTRCRLTAAADLLRCRPELSIAEVALACGFGSQQYFTTLFGGAYGVTPNRYRLDRGSDEE